MKQSLMLRPTVFSFLVWGPEAFWLYYVVNEVLTWNITGHKQAWRVWHTLLSQAVEVGLFGVTLVLVRFSAYCGFLKAPTKFTTAFMDSLVVDQFWALKCFLETRCQSWGDLKADIQAEPV